MKSGYLGITRSIPLLLLTWLLASSRNQPRYWLWKLVIKEEDCIDLLTNSRKKYFMFNTQTARWCFKRWMYYLILFPMTNIPLWNRSHTKNVESALWILMDWCFSTHMRFLLFMGWYINSAHHGLTKIKHWYKDLICIPYFPFLSVSICGLAIPSWWYVAGLNSPMPCW